MTDHAGSISRDDFEDVFSAVNEALQSVQEGWSQKLIEPKHPVIFIVGVQRSGTTLFLQSLLNWARLSYADNVTACFWKAPIVGGALSAAMRRTGSTAASNYCSDTGRTNGWDGPHEFGYFWRRWFGGQETHCLSDEQLAQIDGPELKRELAALEYFVDEPLVVKNPIFTSFHIGFLADLLERSIFVHCTRDPVYVAQSTLESRVRLFGTKESWMGLKPPEYPALMGRPPLEQVAGQVYHCRRHIEFALATVPEGRKLVVPYDKFCEDPEFFLQHVDTCVSAQGGSLSRSGQIVQPFTRTDDCRLPPAEFQRLRELCRAYCGEGH